MGMLSVLTKNTKKIFFKEATKDGIMSNKKFWTNFKPYKAYNLTNKDCISNDFISVEKDGYLKSNKKELVDLSNQNYIHKHSGKLLRKEIFITWRLLKCFSRTYH